MPTNHHLKENPFKENRHDHKMIGRTAELRKIIACCEEAMNGKYPTIVPMTGAFGMGKTFTLLQLRELLRESERYNKPKKVLTAYFVATEEKFPTKYSHYVYTRIIDDLGKEGMMYLREELEKTHVHEDKLLAKLREDDFRNVFKNMKDQPDLAWAWFRGASLSAKQLEKLDAFSRIKGDEEAGRCLLDLLRLLKALGYDGFVILMDELEQVYGQGSAAISKTLIWMRELYDRVVRILSQDQEEIVPVMIVFGCAPEAWQAILVDIDKKQMKGVGGGLRALRDRIPEENETVLKPFDLKEMHELLQELLSKSWMPNFKPTEPVYPFNEEATYKILEISQGIPRFIIRCSRILLREADEENKNIDKNTTDRWLRKAGILISASREE
jgi:hypothetical protein